MEQNLLKHQVEEPQSLLPVPSQSSGLLAARVATASVFYFIPLPLCPMKYELQVLQHKGSVQLSVYRFISEGFLARLLYMNGIF